MKRRDFLIFQIRNRSFNVGLVILHPPSDHQRPVTGVIGHDGRPILADDRDNTLSRNQIP